MLKGAKCQHASVLGLHDDDDEKKRIWNARCSAYRRTLDDLHMCQVFFLQQSRCVGYLYLRDTALCVVVSSATLDTIGNCGQVRKAHQCLLTRFNYIMLELLQVETSLIFAVVTYFVVLLCNKRTNESFSRNPSLFYLSLAVIIALGAVKLVSSIVFTDRQQT